MRDLTCICGHRWPSTAGYTCRNCNRQHPAARRIDQTDQGAQLVLPGAERHDPPAKLKPRRQDPRQSAFDL